MGVLQALKNLSLLARNSRNAQEKGKQRGKQNNNTDSKLKEKQNPSDGASGSNIFFLKKINSLTAWEDFTQKVSAWRRPFINCLKSPWEEQHFPSSRCKEFWSWNACRRTWEAPCFGRRTHSGKSLSNWFRSFQPYGFLQKILHNSGYLWRI